MKADWTPPRGVIKLTYSVSKKEIERLSQINERAKSSREPFMQAIIRIKCNKQSDANYKKWDVGDITIVNFIHKDKHVYMRLLNISRIYNFEFGIGYKLFAYTIGELPK